MAQYAGDEDNFPDDYTIPDDSAPPTAAQNNIAHEALGDRTAWLKKRVAIVPALQALNWTEGGNMGSLDQIRRAVFEPKTRQWLAVDPGNMNNLFRSYDDGLSWTSLKSTLDAIGGGPLYACYDVDIAPDGTVVVALDGTGHVYAYNGSAWSDVTATVDTHEDPGIVYSPVHSQWCLVQRPGSTLTVAPKVYTSTNRSTWTQRTSPFTEFVGSQALRVNKTTGRMYWIIDYLAGGVTPTIKCAVSDDGGVTWGGVVTIAAPAGVMVDGSYVSIDEEDDGRLYIPIATLAGLNTKLYTSGDHGATFSLASTITAERFGSVVGIGGVVVATAFDSGGGVLAKSDLAYSTDRGASWKGGGMRFATLTETTVFAGAGGFIAFVEGGDTFRSIRGGAPGWDLT